MAATGRHSDSGARQPAALDFLLGEGARRPWTREGPLSLRRRGPPHLASGGPRRLV